MRVGSGVSQLQGKWVEGGHRGSVGGFGGVTEAVWVGSGVSRPP